MIVSLLDVWGNAFYSSISVATHVDINLLNIVLSIVQIEDCRTRYNGDADHHQRRKKFTFPARLICGDCYEVIAVL